MYYHRFNNLSELLKGYLAAKIGRVIISKDLMVRECNCSLPSKVNEKCVYGGKFRNTFFIYEVKCSMCDAVYICNTQKTLRKRMGGRFYDILHLLKTRQKPDSFSTYFEKQFNATTSHTDLLIYLAFKVESI